MVNRFKGCLVGLACGDYLGMPVEFVRDKQAIIDYFEGKLKPVSADRNGRKPVGYYTDDTSLAICLTESLIEKGFDVSDQVRRYKKWLLEGYATPLGDKAFGIGKQTFLELTKIDEDNLKLEFCHNELHGGNGALMRIAPIGLKYHHDHEQLKEHTKLATIVTHNNLLAYWTGLVLNNFIGYSLKNLDKEEFVDEFLDTHEGMPGEVMDILKSDYSVECELENTAYTVHTLNVALDSFFNTKTFEACITRAVFAGGDTDTQGAVAGALAGAYYGYDDIPIDWRESLMNRQYIEELAEQLHKSL